jgi:hypothetical protein
VSRVLLMAMCQLSCTAHQKKRRENIFPALQFENKIKQIEVWLNGLVASVISLTRCKGINNFFVKQNSKNVVLRKYYDLKQEKSIYKFFL